MIKISRITVLTSFLSRLFSINPPTSAFGLSCPSSPVRRLSSILPHLSSIVLLVFLLTSCGGGGSSGPSGPANVGGGYTLQVSGGTLNDGTGTNGIVVLATLRNSGGNGPGAAGWQISITGPGFGAPLTVSYDDGSPFSYMTWWWENFNPLSGSYTATATDGNTTLVYQFCLTASSNLSQPALNKTNSTIFWNSITGAGSYYYRVTDGTCVDVMTGYFSSDPLQTTYSFDLPYLTDGSYLVEVYAQTTDRGALQSDPSPSPALASQENMSLVAMDFVQGCGYSLSSRGGVLYEGEYPTGTPHYGLVIWSSILTTTATPTPPAGD